VDWDEDEQLRQMLRLALLRRHLTDSQRAALAARLYKQESAPARQERARKGGRAGGRGRKRGADSSKDGASSKLSTGRGKAGATRRRQDAEKFGVSERKLKHAIEIDTKDPAALDEVIQGGQSLSAARRKLQGAGKASGGPAGPSHADSEKPAENAETGGPTVAAAAPTPPLLLKQPTASPQALLEALAGRLGLGQAVALLEGALAIAKERQAATDDAAVDDVPKPESPVVPPDHAAEEQSS
jgi:hypothetical protein